MLLCVCTRKKQFEMSEEYYVTVCLYQKEIRIMGSVFHTSDLISNWPFKVNDHSLN
jgi:hypothetical protein